MLDWSASLQKRARKIARECGLVGLTLIKNGKKAQVKYRKAEGSKVISQETVMLKFEWIKSNEDDRSLFSYNSVFIVLSFSCTVLSDALEAYFYGSYNSLRCVRRGL